jgi:hypothetical protein
MAEVEKLDPELERRVALVMAEGYAGEGLDRKQYNLLWFVGIVIPVVLVVLVYILF